MSEKGAEIFVDPPGTSVNTANDEETDPKEANSVCEREITVCDLTKDDTSTNDTRKFTNEVIISDGDNTLDTTIEISEAKDDDSVCDLTTDDTIELDEGNSVNEAGISDCHTVQDTDTEVTEAKNGECVCDLTKDDTTTDDRRNTSCEVISLDADTTTDIISEAKNDINVCDAERDNGDAGSGVMGTKNDDNGDGRTCTTSEDNNIGDRDNSSLMGANIDDEGREHCSTEIGSENIKSNVASTEKDGEDRLPSVEKDDEDRHTSLEKNYENKISCVTSTDKDAEERTSYLTGMEKDDEDGRISQKSIESNEREGSKCLAAIQKDDRDRESCPMSSEEKNDEDSPMILEDMISLDANGDGDVQVEECSGPFAKLEMPEGVRIETEVVTINDEENLRSALDVIPSYKADIQGVLADREFSMVTGKPVIVNDARPRRTCFNCDGDHNLSDCPQPYDAARVAANRKKYQSTRTSSVRYHEDCENKYGQYQPGRLSPGLRHALGLRGNDLPLFIYRMRVLGYPPGWLRDAEVHQAEVKMYDGQGRSVSHPDEEEGEAEPTTVRYQPDKLISFPGFNDPLPHGVRDEYYRYSVPPMQMHHQRSEFLRFMNENKAQAYRKRKLKGTEEKPSVPIPPLASDMDVDDRELVGCDIEFNPPLPEEPMPPAPPDDTPPLPPLPKRRDSLEEGEVLDDDSQDSVSGLEIKRQKLLTELNDAATEDTSTSNDDTKDSNQESSQDESQEEKPSEEDGTLDSKPKRHHRSHSKGFEFGVFIPESCTPFTSLPDTEKWTVDVSDHINFDNLPDALGTWNKMKGLMMQVKKRMSKLHQDVDDE